jgi:FecR protein
LQPGQSLATGTGKAEVLLTPGVFLRVGAKSSVKMISPSITDTEVGVEKGHAMVEVDEIHPENDIRITEDGATTRVLKTGLYDFDSNRERLRVFDGKAFVEDGGKPRTVKGGREISFGSNGPLKVQKFNKKSYEEGDLYRWSSLRSAYLAEANVDAAGIYAGNGWGPWGPGWWGADWYWDPWFDAFTFIPGDGIFYSPFGWGFYSPWWVYEAPLYGYGYGRGYGYGPGTLLSSLRH